MPTQNIIDDLIELLRDASPSALPEPLPIDCSLTDGLGLDSLVLTHLFSGIRQRFGPVELTDWFIASMGSRDTLASLADWLAAAAELRYPPTATSRRGCAARR